MTAKVNGRLEVVSIRIDPKLVADGDTELLEDLVIAAVNAGLAKARDAAAQSLASLAGGMPLGLFPTWAASIRLGGGEALTMPGSDFGRRRSTDFGPGPLAGNRRQVGRAAGSPPAQVPPEEALELAEAIRAAKQQIRHCQICFHLTEADQPVCAICRDARRDQGVVCVVEQSRDLMAMEKAGTSRAFTTFSWAGWPRSRAWGRISSQSTPWKHGSAQGSSAS